MFKKIYHKFHDLRILVANFCRHHLHTFSANFFGLMNRLRHFFTFRMYGNVCPSTSASSIYVCLAQAIALWSCMEKIHYCSSLKFTFSIFVFIFHQWRKIVCSVSNGALGQVIFVHCIKRGGWNYFIFVHCSMVGKVAVAEVVVVVGGGQFIFVSRLSGSVCLLAWLGEYSLDDTTTVTALIIVTTVTNTNHCVTSDVYEWPFKTFPWRNPVLWSAIACPLSSPSNRFEQKHQSVCQTQRERERDPTKHWLSTVNLSSTPSLCPTHSAFPNIPHPSPHRHP